MINAGGALLKKRRDNNDLVLSGKLGKGIGTWTGNFFRKLEIPVVFALAEILRTKQLLRADDLRATPGCAAGQRERLFEVRVRIGGTRGLNQTDSYDVGGDTFHSPDALVEPHNSTDFQALFVDGGKRLLKVKSRRLANNGDFLRFFACTARAKDFNSGQVT